MDISKLLNQTGEWLNSNGKDSDIVISSRIRLARNSKNFSFVNNSTLKQKKRIEQFLSVKLRGIKELQEYIYAPLHNLEVTDIYFLFERHLISKEHANGDGNRSVLFNKNESTSIMINEEDHLRIQMMCSGLDFFSLWEEIDKLDSVIEKYIPYAFHHQFGYLTSCPTNLGTGLRGSAMLHLPCLFTTGKMKEVSKLLHKHNLMLRGVYGEGSQNLGNFFQLSNQITLGKNEKKILKNLEFIIKYVIKYERLVREKVLNDTYRELVASIKKSYETLCTSETLSTTKAIKNLSNIRLGVDMKLLSIDISKINQLFLLSYPAHIQKSEGEKLSANQRDKSRALLFKQYLTNN